MYPHRLSRGGYRKLEKRIILEKQQETGDDRIPSPPSRHEKWKRARLSAKGEYTSEASRVVAEKIVSMICFAYVICYLNALVTIYVSCSCCVG